MASLRVNAFEHLLQMNFDPFLDSCTDSACRLRSNSRTKLEVHWMPVAGSTYVHGMATSFGCLGFGLRGPVLRGGAGLGGGAWAGGLADEAATGRSEGFGTGMERLDVA